MGSTEDHTRPWVIQKRIAEFLKDYGPAFTLVAIVATSIQTCRAYDLSNATSAAELYVRDVAFVIRNAPDGGGLFTTDVAAVVINGGQRTAHLHKHKLEFVRGRVDWPTPELKDNATDDVEETIDHDHPLTFTRTIPTEILPQLPPGVPMTADTVYQVLFNQGERLYFLGKIQYSDRVGTRWKPWCRRLASNNRWESCPPLREP